jgi:hypothetical protein
MSINVSPTGHYWTLDEYYALEKASEMSNPQLEPYYTFDEYYALLSYTTKWLDICRVPSQ